MTTTTIRYIVVLAYAQGEVDGIPAYYFKYVTDWREDSSNWGTRFVVGPDKGEALKVDRDTALEMANALRARNVVPATVMVEEV